MIAKQVAECQITEPKNLEEQALSLGGRDVYEKLIKGYTEKQWGRDCKELPAFIIKRLPSVLLMTTIISMTAIREFRSAVIMESSRRC